MGEFSEIFKAAFEAKKPMKLTEIGSEYGGSTKIIANYAKNNSAYAYIVDPSPFADLTEVLAEYNGFYEHRKEKSLDALLNIPACDFYFIDGDHNYYTVYNELKLIHEKNPKAWIFLHDVGWPWAYRDLYYAPELIPSEGKHEYTYTDGVGAENNLIQNGGFRGEGMYAISKKFSGEKNGVLKAIEDFIAPYDADLYFSKIAPIFGLGLITPVEDQAIAQKILAPYQIKLMDRMERNRLELYLKVIELQGEIQNTFSKLPYRIMRKMLSIFDSKNK